MSLTQALALSANQYFYARKSPYEYVHSVRIELAKLITAAVFLVVVLELRSSSDDTGATQQQWHTFWTRNILVVSDLTDLMGLLKREII